MKEALELVEKKALLYKISNDDYFFRTNALLDITDIKSKKTKFDSISEKYEKAL